MWRSIGKSVLIAVGALLAFAIAILLLPVGLTIIAINSGRALVFRLRYRGRAYLVSSRRAGWHPFVMNNVAPVLPPNTEVIFLDRYGRGRGLPPPRVVQLAQRAVWGERKPYILTVEAMGFRVTPLHDRLVPLKSQATRDETIQRSVGEILAEV